MSGRGKLIEILIAGSAEKLWIKSEPLESGFTENFPMKREYDVEPFTDTTCFTTQETICKSEFICDDDGGYEAPPSSVNVGIKSGEKRKRRSDDNAPFKCKECGKEFTLRASYGRHIQGHSNFKPYACHTCGMRFGQKAHALTHQRTHTSKRITD
ncbi:Neurotrophin receptor-interacting factor like [Pseudolycoriella hygida]|uniref:Neurotrophin receptor-interacting factor like n=1 Tax=Pseudolycoriella hygida TaxID=35572 RepID=A0A9Q0N468_9DIPT|nr:Neurotrophin receptor-interacting factor like [Pseudolycoriella hygida]